MSNAHLFVSYARADFERIKPVIEAIKSEFKRRALDADVWVDLDRLKPGEMWTHKIERALTESIGLIVFVSPASMGSNWVAKKLSAAGRNDSLIFPIILDHVSDLPAFVSNRQWLDLSGPHLADRHRIRRAAREVQALRLHMAHLETRSPVTKEDRPRVAADLAKEVRERSRPLGGGVDPPDSVFLVHGHDKRFLQQIEEFLSKHHVKPIVLSKQRGDEQSLFQRFIRVASNARFAIAILSADDFGASRIQYETDGVGDRALQFRARQNVILELGFFYGLLGWENVFVLYRPPSQVFPNFERPSDIDGVVFEQVDDHGVWKRALSRKLVEAGFDIQESE